MQRGSCCAFVILALVGSASAGDVPATSGGTGDALPQATATIEATDKGPDCAAMLDAARVTQAGASKAAAEKRWAESIAAYSSAQQSAKQALAGCSGEAQAKAQALLRQLIEETTKTNESRIRAEVCRPAIDKALALDLQAAAAKNNKLEIDAVEKLYAMAESTWREAAASCQGKDRNRAMTGLADTEQAHAAIRELSAAGKECDEAWRRADAMVELGKTAWAEKRWNDSAMLYRKAAMGWEVAEEKCVSGDRHTQAGKKQESAELDAHNAANCAPRWDEARELAQRLKVEGQVLAAKERGELSMRAEAAWRMEAEYCVGPAKDKAKSNAEAIAKERGTPLDAALLQEAMAAAKPKTAAPAVAVTGALPTNGRDAPAAQAAAVALPSVETQNAPRAEAPPARAELAPPALAAPPVAAAAPLVAKAAEPTLPAAAAAAKPAETPGLSAAAASAEAPTAKGMAHLVKVAPNVFKLGDISYEGTFQVDQDTRTLSGNGSIKWENGNVFVGTVVKGEKQGKGKFTWNDGQVYDGEWLNNHMDGMAEIRYPNGDRYIGMVKDGARHGRGKFTYATGGIFEGDFRDGRFEGFGRFTWKNGDYYEGNWKADKKNGQGEYVWVSGSRATEIYENGILMPAAH